MSVSRTIFCFEHLRRPRAERARGRVSSPRQNDGSFRPKRGDRPNQISVRDYAPGIGGGMGKLVCPCYAQPLTGKLSLAHATQRGASSRTVIGCRNSLDSAGAPRVRAEGASPRTGARAARRKPADTASSFAVTGLAPGALIRVHRWQNTSYPQVPANRSTSSPLPPGGIRPHRASPYGHVLVGRVAAYQGVNLPAPLSKSNKRSASDELNPPE